MATRILTTSYLVRLSNANHGSVTSQILERLQGLETDNQMLVEAVAALQQCCQNETASYGRYTAKDFASDDLKAADVLEDKYMSTIRNSLNALLYLPESEPIRRKAELAVQLFKDFNFWTNNGYEAEATKTVKMVRQWTEATEYSLAELGIEEWAMKAMQQANNVLQLISLRLDNVSAKVKGEMAEARKATDAAVRTAYDIVNSMAVLQPSAELRQVIGQLFAIGDRAKQYYITVSKTNDEAMPATSDLATAGGGEDAPIPSGNDNPPFSEGPDASH